ncbi:DUF421 domain-containing protein [Flavobacterium sp. NST-5]|uniref:DUF421 domain-containing protein n=1 Tax=Flavobacterium ichthyis TaxID=2698827 RepID=A0ABW9ZA93_9FLAO|nr:YetF domain-containing protein [Flavobacterium ichthyis]NBL65811.1 DUF421 domain-containing protein [Flavobacterium ichthyis]
MEKIFEWNRVLMNELPYQFLFEIFFRASIMFIILLITLRLTGKRGVRQLSIFETVIIIALGSAAGDPMFYEDVGILPAITVFIIIIAIYRFVTFLTGKFRWFEVLVEGKTHCLIKEGRFAVKNFKREGLAQDEFFAELRLRNISHLGQVKSAYLETTGDVSVFFYEDAEVKLGLPILPELFEKKSKHIPESGKFACCNCGNVQEHQQSYGKCEVCQKDIWVKPINSKRIS